MKNIEGQAESQGTALAKHRTELAVRRSAIAAERTLMAWIRTAISMIGFGFTIYKFFEYLPSEIAGENKVPLHAPRNLGLTLITLGTLALAAATWQHRKFLMEIEAWHLRREWSISFLVAIAVVLIGILAFYGVLLREGPY